MRYGALYLKPKLWKKLVNDEPSIDPNVLLEDGSFRKELPEHDTLEDLYGTNSIYTPPQELGVDQKPTSLGVTDTRSSMSRVLGRLYPLVLSACLSQCGTPTLTVSCGVGNWGPVCLVCHTGVKLPP